MDGQNIKTWFDKTCMNFYNFYLFIYLLAAPVACGSFQAREQTHTAAAAYTTYAAAPDP